MASTVVGRDKLRRWSLVATVTAVLLALPAVVAALPPEQRPVDPTRLRELITASAARPHHGYAESTGSLGVPDLPNLSQVTSLLNGTTRVRTWYDSPEHWRFDVLSTAGERDVYRTQAGEFAWDSGANLLTEVIGAQPVRLPRAGDVLPPELARRVLASALGDPVSALPAKRVAGVSAAGLRVRPADQDTTVGQVDIWADPATGLPVLVEVTARGADRPVLVTRFVELTIGRPDAAALTPIIPPDAGFTVTTAPDIAETLGTATPAAFPSRLAGRALRTAELAGLPGIALYGTGLSAFAVLALPRRLAGSAADAAGKAAARELILPGGNGMLLEVTPMTAIVLRSEVARRSYLLAGLVVPGLLERAAAELSTVPRGGR